MLSEYISSLPKEGKLSREEEARLWDAYKNEGELEARQKLIEHYQLLVFKEATKYPVQETVLLDLIQEGTVGLMEAAEKFDIEQGVAFSLYAIHRIRGRMLDFLRKGQNDILMGEEQEEKLFTLQVAPDTAFEITDRNSLHSAVSMAVNRLPMKEQDVIRSVYLKEKTVAETANEMDVSTAYVYRLEKRGIHRLRGMLSKLMHVNSENRYNMISC